MIVVMVVLSTALVPSTAVAQQQTESSSESDSLIPYEVQQIINQEPSEVSQEDINRVQEWYSSNSDSLPDPVSNSVQGWLEEAQSQSETKYDGPVWDEVSPHPFPDRWGNEARVYFVEYDQEQGIARVYIETDSEQTVVVADGTRQTTGPQNKTIQTVHGREILTVQLDNPELKHISITISKGTWLHFGPDSELQIKEPVDYPIILAPISGLLVLVLVVGLHRFSARYRDSAKNPIEG